MKAAGVVAFISFLYMEFPFVSGAYRKIPNKNNVFSVIQVCVSCSCTKQRFLIVIRRGRKKQFRSRHSQLNLPLLPALAIFAEKYSYDTVK